MQVSTGLSVDETDHIAITNELQVCVGIKLRLVAVWIDEPVIVGILVVVAGNLLLVRSFRVCLDVRVQEATSVAHILEGDPRAKSNLEWAVLADLGASQVRLEQRTHLGITRATVRENKEMQVERKHVYQDWDDDQTSNASKEVLCQHSLAIAGSNDCFFSGAKLALT